MRRSYCWSQISWHVVNLLDFHRRHPTFFCSCCRIVLDDIENVNPSSWPVRTQEEHRKAAIAWKNALNMAVRESIFDLYGVRWSELLRLPCWDPLQYAVNA